MSVNAELDVNNSLKNAIKGFWKELITYEYDEGFLFREDSLKCAFYLKIRAYLDEKKLTDENYRVYPEYFIGKKKADLVIVKLTDDWRETKRKSKNCIEEINVIMELKYRAKSSIKPFAPDVVKLAEYLRREDCKRALAFACFIDEDDDPDRVKDWTTEVMSEAKNNDQVEVLSASRIPGNKRLRPIAW